MTLRDRFLGSKFGLVWAIASPVMMLSIFTFVFGFVFRSKLPGSESSLAYVIWLVSGYGPWLAISEGVMTATTSVTSSAQLVKNMKFKYELLPIAGGIMGLVPLAVAVGYLTVLMFFEGIYPAWSWTILPIVVVIQFILISGIGFFFAALNVFVRDIQHVLPNLLLIVMFSSPIFYAITAFPSIVQKPMAYNPIYLLAEAYRQPLLYGVMPPVWTLFYIAIIAAVLFVAGLVMFRRLSFHFESQL